MPLYMDVHRLDGGVAVVEAHGPVAEAIFEVREGA